MGWRRYSSVGVGWWRLPKPGAHVDNVFDLARVLRVPGTLSNNPPATGTEPIPVVCCRVRVALTLADVDKRLLAYGIREILDFLRKPNSRAIQALGNSLTNVFYAAAMIDVGAEDAQWPGMGKARHHWFLSQAVRIGVLGGSNVSPKAITNTPKSF
jgi:hypothetical protein